MLLYKMLPMKKAQKEKLEYMNNEFVTAIINAPDSKVLCTDGPCMVQYKQLITALQALYTTMR